MAANSNKPSSAFKPRRRWFRYSLRTLLVLMLLVCAGFGWLAHKMKEAKDQREAVHAIHRGGGSVHYAPYQDHLFGPQRNSKTPPGPQWLSRLLGDDMFLTVDQVELYQPTDADLEQLKKWNQLEYLYATDGEITDAGLIHLESLSRLKFLDLARNRITDGGLEHLKALSHLGDLRLDGTQITDAGLERLKTLTHLRWLDLSGTQITDAGLSQLAGLRELENLGLERTQITDAGLVHLEGLNALRQLYMPKTKATDAGINKLKQALPRLKVDQ